MRLFPVIMVCLFSACTNSVGINPQKKETAKTDPVVTHPPFDFDYEKLKLRSQAIYQNFNLLPNDSNRNKLTSFIADSLLPCWYGTPWDFNGTTTTPQSGKIACGYFVTTVLQDGGYKINRIKMAQCASEQLVKATCTEVSRFSRVSIDEFVNEVKKKGHGLFIVGLDNHTGFILNDSTGTYFIHSGVYSPQCALKEPAIDSRTLINSSYRVIGKIKF